MADRAITPLEKLAADVADLREQRVELLRQEQQLLAQGLAVMKQLNKTAYHHDGIDIRVVPGSDVIKLRVKTVVPVDSSGPD